LADQPISGLTALTGANTASGDLLEIVDVSDTTMAATGTNKKITRDEMKTALLAAPGPIGGTTPAAGSFTTLSTSDVITSTRVTNIFQNTGASTNGKWFRLTNTGGDVLFGLNNSTGAQVLTGGTAYSFCISTAVNVPIEFGVNDTKIASLASTGLAVTGAISATTTGKVGTTLGVGNATPAASGAGITFPATANRPSSEPNTLWDYEEGTYTVTLTPQTSGTITLSGAVNEGAYTKVGRVVTITAQVQIDSVSSPSGSYIDFSIPFAIANLTDSAGRVYFAGVYQQGNSPFTTSINRVLGIETFSTVRFYITAATVAAGDELGIAFSYFTE